MTWKHVALVGLAISLVLLCGVSNVCSSNSATFAGVLQLAATIIGIAGGHAHGGNHPNAPRIGEERKIP